MLVFIIINVLLHYVVVKETRNWHIMPLNNATLLFLNNRSVYLCIRLYMSLYFCIRLYTSVYVCIHLYTFVYICILFLFIVYVCIHRYTIFIYCMCNGTVITGKFCVGVPLNIQSIYLSIVCVILLGSHRMLKYIYYFYAFGVSPLNSYLYIHWILDFK